MNKPAHSYLATIVVLLAAAVAPLAAASSTPSASDYISFPTVNQGETLIIDFAFDPEMNLIGFYGANALTFNVGGGGFASNTKMTLYAGTTALGTTFSYSGAASGMFTSSDLTFPSGYFWSTQVSGTRLNSILDGSESARLEVTPIGGDMTWGGWGPHAGVLTGTLAYQDVFPIANISSITVSSVPIPSSIVLFASGLSIMGFLTRKNKKFK